MLEQLQHPDTVPNAQGDALVPGDDLFGRRKRIAHDKGRQVEAFVGGRRSKDALFLAGRAKLNAIVPGSAKMSAQGDPHPAA